MLPTPSPYAPSNALSSSQPSQRQMESGKPIASTTYLRPISIRQPAPRKASLFALPKEPEDAQITGGTRSLDRRLLALNLAGSRRQPAQPTLRSIQPSAA
jgi:hypothetical protein